MNLEEMIEKIDVDIEDAKRQIDLRDSLNRLHENKDFQAVIMEGYIKEEASRIALCLADAEFQTPEKQEQLNKMAYGIGGLFQYFRKLSMMAQMSESALHDHEQAKADMLAEEGEVIQ
jgi:hypothetical protein